MGLKKDILSRIAKSGSAGALHHEGLKEAGNRKANKSDKKVRKAAGRGPDPGAKFVIAKLDPSNRKAFKEIFPGAR